MKKDDNPKTDEEAWAVEPPKKVGSKKRKALRVALIVAALGAIAFVGTVLIVGNSIAKQFETVHTPGLIGRTVPDTPNAAIQSDFGLDDGCAESFGMTIAGGKEEGE